MREGSYPEQWQVLPSRDGLCGPFDTAKQQLPPSDLTVGAACLCSSATLEEHRGFFLALLSTNAEGCDTSTALQKV